MNQTKLDQLFKFLDIPSRPLVGIDVSPTSIKCVELTSSRSGELTIENYSIEPTPREAFSDQGIENTDLLGAAIERAWKRLGTKVKNIAIAMPSNVAIIKKVKFSMDLDELAVAEEVLVEASQFIPFPLDDVNLDWVVLGPHPNAPETDNEVLICATRRDRIVDYMAAGEAAGLKAIKVDIDTFAMQLAFDHLQSINEQYQTEVIAVADAGSSTLNLSVYNKTDGQVFTKEIPYGSNQLTENICAIYNISPEQANEAKRNGGQGLTDYFNQAVEPFLEGLAVEINRSLQFFLTQAEVERIDRIMLAGGCAALQNAAEVVGRSTQITTTIFNPFEGMEIASRLKNRNLEQEAPMLLTACGLALRRFDDN